MKVFISWSGKRSKETADVLSSWIRQVIQAAEPWISLDIEKGARWNERINNELEHTKVGIICLDKDNLTSEWILFEAGALSKTSDAHVCTLLLDVNPADIKPPLGQFQHTLFSKEDIKKLMHTINNKISALNEKTIPEKDLDEVFEVFWPRLEARLESIKNIRPEITKQTRTDREILEEILQLVRANHSVSTSPNYDNILDTLRSSSVIDAMHVPELYLNFHDLIDHVNIKLDPTDIERVHQAKEHLLSNLENPVSISELAHLVHLNEYKLKLGFKQLYKNTVFGLLQDERLQKARMLLAETGMTVQDVSLLTGYKNLANFTAAFKRKFGFPPSARK